MQTLQESKFCFIHGDIAGIHENLVFVWIGTAFCLSHCILHGLAP